MLTPSPSNITITVVFDDQVVVFTTKEAEELRVVNTSAESHSQAIYALHHMVAVSAQVLPTSDAGFHLFKAANMISRGFKHFVDRMANPSQFQDDDLPF